MATDDKNKKSTGATFSIKERKKDLDNLELLDGTQVWFKSMTDFEESTSVYSPVRALLLRRSFDLFVNTYLYTGLQRDSR